jgi:hypothetical protein
MNGKHGTMDGCIDAVANALSANTEFRKLVANELEKAAFRRNFTVTENKASIQAAPDALHVINLELNREIKDLKDYLEKNKLALREAHAENDALRRRVSGFEIRISEGLLPRIAKLEKENLAKADRLKMIEAICKPDFDDSAYLNKSL